MAEKPTNLEVHFLACLTRFGKLESMNLLEITTLASNAPYPAIRAGEEIECMSGESTEKDEQIAFSFSLYPVLSLSLSHTHALKREAAEASCWARLILAGERRPNPVR